MGRGYFDIMVSWGCMLCNYISFMDLAFAFAFWRSEESKGAD